jgi:hypothetical protein
MGSFMEQFFTELFKYSNKTYYFVLKDNTCIKIDSNDYKNEHLEKEWLPCECVAGNVKCTLIEHPHNLKCSCTGPTYIKVLYKTFINGFLAFSYTNLAVRYIAQSIQYKNDSRKNEANI